MNTRKSHRLPQSLSHLQKVLLLIQQISNNMLFTFCITMPIITDWLDVLVEKENTGELHPSFAEKRHESSNSRPVISDAKHQLVYPCQSINWNPSQI
jgi:hypothetical protein